MSIVTDSAIAQLGKPYVFDTPLDRNAANPGTFDCSGLTMWCYQRAGITLPHNAAAQYLAMTHRPIDQAQAGDVMFWMDGGTIGHCAIYMGDGSIIEAPEPGKNVQRMPYAYWKQPLSNVGAYNGPQESDVLSSINIANLGAAQGVQSPSSSLLGFTDGGFFGWITNAKNWARIGLGTLGAIILLFIVIHYLGVTP